MTRNPEGTQERNAGDLYARLARWIRAPLDPPTTPPGTHEWERHFRPAEAFLRYLKAKYWIGAAFAALILIPTVVLVTAGIATGVDSPLAAWVLLTFFGVVVLVPILLSMIAGYALVQMRYDTTWYVLTDRALRVRRGILTIREQTVTLDNVQNMKVRQGPIQRWLGIADLTVETAASGAASQSGTTIARGAVLEGVANPLELRQRIRDRMRQSRSQGIGDREPLDGRERGSQGADAGAAARGTRGADAGAAARGPRAAGEPTWTPAHLDALRQILVEVRQLG